MSNKADVIPFTQVVCTTSKEQHTLTEKQTAKKTLTPDKKFEKQLTTLPATELRKLYPQEYNSWRNLKYRAKKSNLDVSPELESWRDFLNYMGQAPDTGFTVDRKNNNQGYVVGNLRWASKVTQGNNKTNNKTLTVEGTTLTVAQWAKLTDTSVDTIRSRMKKVGWSDYEIVYGKVAPTKTSNVTLSHWAGLRPLDAPHDTDWPTPWMIQRYKKFHKSPYGRLLDIPLPPKVWLAACFAQQCRKLSAEIQEYNPMEDGDVPEKLDREYDRVKSRLEQVRPLALHWCQTKLNFTLRHSIDFLFGLPT